MAVEKEFPPSSQAIQRIGWSIFAFSLIVFGTIKYGAGISPDSVGYISVARNLANHGELTLWNGNPLSIWPPLYPALLAGIFKITRSDPVATAPLVNGILFALVTWFSIGLLHRYVETRNWFTPIGAYLLVMSPPLVSVALMAWTELLFSLFLVGCIYGMRSYRERLSMASLVPLIVWTAAACMTRYIGIVLIGTGALIILSARTPLGRKLGHTVVFGIGSSAPLMLWLLRNHRLGFAPTGSRGSSSISLLNNLLAAVVVLLEWLPWILPFGIFLYVLGRAQNRQSPRIPADRNNTKIWSNLVPPLSIIVGYLGFLVISASVVHHDPINTRLVSPIYVPLVIVIVVLGDHAYRRIVDQFDKPARKWFLRLLLAALVAYPLAYVGWTAANAHLGRVTRLYNSARWKESALLSRAHSLPDWKNSAVYSNYPNAVYYWTGISAQPLPTRYADLAASEKNLQTLKGNWPERPGYVLWFQDAQRQSTLSPMEFRHIVQWKVIAELDDGVLSTIAKTNP